MFTQNRLVNRSTFLKPPLEIVEINRAEDRLESSVVKSTLGQTPDERHLTAFESRTNGTARSGLLALVTFAGSLSLAGTFTNAKTLATFFSTGIWT